MRNLSIENGLVKNAQVVVRELHERFVKVELLPNSTHMTAGKIYCLTRIIFEFQLKFCPWTVQRRQFPLQLAYSTDFNSCQALTFIMQLLSFVHLYSHMVNCIPVSPVYDIIIIFVLFSETTNQQV